MVFVFNETLKYLLNRIIFKDLNSISRILVFDYFQNICRIMQVRNFVLHA
jgi:hypothetical protein